MTTFSPRSTDDILTDLNLAVQVHSLHRHLTRFKDPETPYFPLVDTNWALLHRLDYNESEIFLKNRAAKGFTSIMVVLVVQHGLFDYPDRQGEWMFEPHTEPFTHTSPTSLEGLDKYRPDISKPNPKFWNHVDRVVRLASDLGIIISFLPTWARWVNGGYWGQPILFDDQELARSYGQFLAERYPFHPWYLGGDGNRYWNPDIKSQLQAGKHPKDIEVTDFGPIFEAMGQGIIAGEQRAMLVEAQGYKTFMTFHPAQPWLPNAPEALASAEWPDADWLSLDGCQTGHHDGVQDTDIKEEGASRAQSGVATMPMWYARSSYVPVRKMYAARDRHGNPRPCMDLEPHYEMIHPGPYWNGDDIRNGAWQAVFAGAAGYTYGCCSLIQFHNDQSETHKPILPPCTSYTNWYHELDLPGVFSASVLRKIMLSLPNFYTRVPDQSFILSETHETKGEVPTGDRLIGGMRGQGWAMVHLPYGDQVTVDLAKALPGVQQWHARWVNPRDGSRLPPFEKGDKPEGSKSFDAPTGGDLKNDWLLYLDGPSAMLQWPRGQATNLGIM